jgi:hypothetical protein
MGTVISNLKAHFGVDTTDFKAGLKDGEKAMSDFKGAAGGQIDEFAKMFGVNMSGVSDAIGTATKSLNFLKEGFIGAAKGGDILSISAKLLKFALISTGIGALIVLLGSVIAYFSKSGEGAEKFAKLLAELKSVLNNVVERLVAFGKGIVDFFSGKWKQGVEEMETAFKGMGAEIKADWKEAGNLAEAEHALEKREISLINSLEERRAKVAELRLQAKEELTDMNKKYSLLTQAESLIKSIYGDQISCENEALRILKAKIAETTKDPTLEQQREIAEQTAKVTALYTEQSTELKALFREKQKALLFVTAELAMEKAKADQVAITKATISNIKMPDFSQVINKTQGAISAVSDTVKELSINISGELMKSFEEIATNLGTFFEQMAQGNGSLKNFGNMMLTTLAELAVQIGKIIISMAIAKGAIEKAIVIPGAWPIALAAGIALVALGSALKGSLSKSSAGSGGSASVSGSSSGSNGLTYDMRSIAQAQTVKVQVTGELVGQGSTLRAVIKNEESRLKLTT